MKPGETLVQECLDCGKPVKAVMVKGQKQKGIFFICEDQHQNRTRRHYTKSKTVTK